MKSEYDNNKEKVNNLKALSREHEPKRFEIEVTVEIQNQGVSIKIQSATLKSKLLILNKTCKRKMYQMIFGTNMQCMLKNISNCNQHTLLLMK